MRSMAPRQTVDSKPQTRQTALAVTPQYKCHKGNLGWEGLPTIFTASQECAWLTRCSMKGWSHHPPFDCVCFCSTSITTSCYLPQEPSKTHPPKPAAPSGKPNTLDTRKQDSQEIRLATKGLAFIRLPSCCYIFKSVLQARD